MLAASAFRRVTASSRLPHSRASCTQAGAAVPLERSWGTGPGHAYLARSEGQRRADAHAA